MGNMVSPQQRPCVKAMMYAAVMLTTLAIDCFGLASAKHISSNIIADPAKPNTSNDGININIEDGEAMPMPRQRQAEAQATNWDLNYVNFTADLSTNSTDELKMFIEIGKDRKFASKLLAGNCESNITEGVFNATTSKRMTLNDTHEILQLGYSLDKAAINGSNIFTWNDTSASAELKMCQVSQLLTDDLAMVITEDIRNITVDIDFSVEYALSQALVAKILKLGMDMPLILVSTNYTVPTAEAQLESDMAVIQKTLMDVLGPMAANRTWTMVNVSMTGLAASAGSNFTNAKFILSLAESCYTEAECNALKNTTTMHNESIAYYNEQINSGDFLTVLLGNAARAGRKLMTQDADAGAAKETSLYRHLPQDSNHHHGRMLEIAQATPIAVVADGYPTFTIADPAANTGFAEGNTDVNSYVSACKCDSAQSFQCNNEALGPNEELFVCIKSIKASEVEVDYLDSLNITQGSNALKVIEANATSIPSITSRTYVPNKDGVAVGTRVPSSIFTYAKDESIVIVGVVVMKLANDGSRRLQFATSDNAGTIDDNAPFQVEIKLAQDGMDFSEEGEVSINSASAIVHKGCHADFVLGAIFILSYMMVW